MAHTYLCSLRACKDTSGALNHRGGRIIIGALEDIFTSPYILIHKHVCRYLMNPSPPYINI